MKNLCRSFMVLILIFMPIVLCSCDVTEVYVADVSDADVNDIIQEDCDVATQLEPPKESLQANDTGITDTDLERVDTDLEVVDTGLKEIDIDSFIENREVVEVLDSDVNEINQKESDAAVQLVTQKEFLEYLKVNDTGIIDADLEGVDIDDFIKTGAFTVDHLGRYNLKVILNAYKQNKATELKESIMAKEIRSADSTDEEYSAFVKAYFEDVGKESIPMGIIKGLDRYDIITENNRYYLYIGKTKNIDQYEILSGGESSRLYFLSIPTGSDEELSLPYCYSKDNKFLLAVLPRVGDDYAHKLSEIFTKVALPQ